MKQIELKTAWGADRKAGQKIYFHMHDFYELVYYCEGEGDSTVAESSYPITPNTLILIPPNVEHEEHHTKDSSLFYIGFCCDEMFTIEILKDYRGIMQAIVLKDIAKQLHLSYDYFQHRFKEIVGESPQQFLVHKRLEAAERLLLEGNLSCTEIAQRCGFANSAQFSMMFKKEKKMSPSKYQKT